MKRPLSARVAVALLLLASGFCWTASAQTTASTTPERPHITVSIGSFVLGFLPLPLAHAQGYFREQGLDVEPQNFGAGGGKALQALVGGSTDAVVGGYDHTIRMQTQGKDIRCLILLNKEPGIALAVRRDLAERIRTVRDLKGARIGITGPGSAADFMTRFLIAKAGLAPGDADIVAVGSGAKAIAGIENREIDAIVQYDPAITVMQRKGLADVLVDLRTREGTHATFGGDFPYTCLYATADFAERNPVTVQRLVNAFVRTLAFIHARTPEEIADATPAEYQLGGRDVFIDVLAASKSMFPVSGRFDAADVERARQFLATFDEKVRSATIRLEDTYTNRFVDAVPAGVPRRSMCLSDSR
jgi:NitT/TauT family transport system substrate-binding protein